MEAERAKSAGDVVSSALSGKTSGSAEKNGASGPRWELLRLSMKLSELSENWREVAGEPLASRSAPAVCEDAGEKLLITVNVPDQMVLSSARFRRARLERGISAFFGGAPVGVLFRVGPVRLTGNRAAPAKVYRRVPIVNSELEIAEREKYFADGGLSPELASAMARVMLSLEKLSKRRSRG
ncbi:DciA family protein [Cloacibacillus sp. An23]|uniref:DciA family protein n=1 Tax=Cloacibacillus sp. An23 TaxID=1965591 RepID=UPI000B3AE1D2|nr:DciA family protein [Cloacibacillus sp. An23]OUO93217.1 hypothetical protein B5F39_07915 [Cloacibacillus sp. An23]